MRRTPRPKEAELLDRVHEYRKEYRQRRLAALAEERARREAAGQVCIAGCWMTGEQAAAVHAPLSRRQLLAAAESLLGVVLLGALALGLWWLFAFLFLP